MIENQRTIARPVSLSGKGLHTGNKTTLTFKPAAPNTGVIFKRTDLDQAPEIPGTIEYVIDNSRDTTIGKDGVEIRQVEHVLAACYGLAIDNVLVEVDSNEPPVGDGSVMPFVTILQDAPVKNIIRIKHLFHLPDDIYSIFAVALFEKSRTFGKLAPFTATGLVFEIKLGFPGKFFIDGLQLTVIIPIPGNNNPGMHG